MVWNFRENRQDLVSNLLFNQFSSKLDNNKRNPVVPSAWIISKTIKKLYNAYIHSIKIVLKNGLNINRNVLLVDFGSADYSI